MNVQEALTNGFRLWLDDVSPPSEQGNLTPGRVLDPYRTSMRTTKNLVPDLLKVATDGQLAHDDPTQRFADLRNAELVDGTYEAPILSDLGSAVVEEWQALGVATEEDEYEIPRAIVLARLGSQRSQTYSAMRQFWDELRAIRDPVEWFAQPQALYLVSYLDRSSADGYRPLAVLTGAGVANWDEIEVWNSWADDFPVPDEWDKSQLHKLLRTVESAATRARGRVTFCQAMEALRLAESTPAELEAAFTSWEIPDA